MSQEEYCKWCGSYLNGEYEEMMDEDEDENGNFIEVYNPVCIECLNGEMQI